MQSYHKRRLANNLLILPGEIENGNGEIENGDLVEVEDRFESKNRGDEESKFLFFSIHRLLGSSIPTPSYRSQPGLHYFPITISHFPITLWKAH